MIGGDLLDLLAATDRLHGDSVVDLVNVGVALAHEWEPPFQGGVTPLTLTMGLVHKNQTISFQRSGHGGEGSREQPGYVT